jgi:hypothetical protein
MSLPQRLLCYEPNSSRKIKVTNNFTLIMTIRMQLLVFSNKLEKNKFEKKKVLYWEIFEVAETNRKDLRRIGYILFK